MENRLSQSSSLYLRQHANNPVHWQPWGTEALERAEREQKLILVSIGYAACHWCHVMEHESFSDPAVADAMNRDFICIKVDREERPDLDHQYMTAVQLLSGHGGWPLNCFALPDGRPVFGGTYFRRSDWLALLERLAFLWQNKPELLRENADNITHHVARHDHIGTHRADREFQSSDLLQVNRLMLSSMDPEYGGTRGAPKFPMPPLLSLGLTLQQQGVSAQAGEMAQKTLARMYAGGIHDHLGGGFARYAVDEKWKVPHFEKMLYDNAQLLGLYARNHRLNGDELSRRAAYGILAFLNSTMKDPNGGYYGSVDADSEGEEGRFYTWTAEEIHQVAEADAQILMKHFCCTDEGNFENGRNILYLETSDPKGLSGSAHHDAITRGVQQLLAHRSHRVHPAIDKKMITAWNSLLVISLVEAAHAFSDPELAGLANTLMDAILKQGVDQQGRLLHLMGTNDEQIPAFLDDYATTILALTTLYGDSFHHKYLKRAVEMTQFVRKHFAEEGSDMFYYVPDGHPVPVARTMELYDHVVPSSNALMAHALKRLAFLAQKPEWYSHCQNMAGNVKGRLLSNPVSYGAWGELVVELLQGSLEITVMGEEATSEARRIREQLGTEALIRVLESDDAATPLQIIACRNQTCHPPVGSVEELFAMIESEQAEK